MKWLPNIERRIAIRLFIFTFSLALFKRNNVYDNTFSLVTGQTHFVAFYFFRFPSQSERGVMRDRWAMWRLNRNSVVAASEWFERPSIFRRRNVEGDSWPTGVRQDSVN